MKVKMEKCSNCGNLDYQFGVLIRALSGGSFVRKWHDTPEAAYEEYTEILRDRIRRDDRQIYPEYYVIVAPKVALQEER